MRQGVGDAIVQHPRNTPHPLLAEVSANDVAPQGQRQPSRPIRPPLPQINQLPQAIVGVSELPLVN